jgi:hypothetical protein
MLTRPRADLIDCRPACRPALSNDVRMSSASESNGRSSGPRVDEGVLANLPRTRPQRSSPRRAAARRTSAASAAGEPPQARAGSSRATSNGAKPGPAKAKAKPTAKARAKPKASAKPKVSAKPKASAGTKPKASAATKPKASVKAATRKAQAPRASVEDSVPRQGFESEMDRATGPVQPPGGAELVSSAAEIFSELARAGLSTGERLLKDALSRLPL